MQYYLGIGKIKSSNFAGDKNQTIFCYMDGSGRYYGHVELVRERCTQNYILCSTQKKYSSGITDKNKNMRTSLQ